MTENLATAGTVPLDCPLNPHRTEIEDKSIAKHTRVAVSAKKQFRKFAQHSKYMVLEY
jgi:hypothetical protein